MTIPEGTIRCAKCGGSGRGQLGETYMEQGGPIMGCSGCDGYGWNLPNGVYSVPRIPANAFEDPNEGNTL